MPDHTQAASAVTPPLVTLRLARHLTTSRPEALPGAVRHEAARAFVNWLGCAVGGFRHQAVDAALAALSPFSGPRTA